MAPRDIIGQIASALVALGGSAVVAALLSNTPYSEALLWVGVAGLIVGSGVWAWLLVTKPAPAADPRVSLLEEQVKALRPRKLSDDQKFKMLEILGDEGGGVILSAETSAGDSMTLRQDLWYVFHRAGWNAATAIVMGRRNPAPCGISVKVPNPSQLTPKQSRVIRALSAVGLKHELAEGQTGNMDMEIEITPKLA